MENEDTRTLRLEIPGCSFTKAAPDPTWTTTGASNGWQVLAGTVQLFWTGTIDLAGYVREMKTFYPAAAFTQKGSHTAEIGNGGTVLYTIVSTTPLDPLEVSANLLAGGGQGFLTPLQTGLGNQNWETVLFAESDLLVTNANIQPNLFGILQTLSSEQSGSLSPTATDTLYVMKMFVPFVNTQTSIMIPPARVIMPGKFGTEPDVEYMMRLKRSVELSQQV
jgi:hypothetical protein